MRATLILFPWRSADVTSDECNFHFILAAVMNIIWSDCRLQVGESVCCKLFFSSNLRATSQAFRNFSPSNFCFSVKTYLHEIAFWLSSSTQVKTLFSIRFFNSFSFASTTACSCSCCSVSINASSNSTCSHHMTSSQFKLYGCSLLHQQHWPNSLMYLCVLVDMRVTWLHFLLHWLNDTLL